MVELKKDLDTASYLERIAREGETKFLHQFNNEVQHLEGLKASALPYADYADNLQTPQQR